MEAKQLAAELIHAIHRKVQLYDDLGEQNNRLMLSRIQPVLEAALENTLPSSSLLPTGTRFHAACAAMQGLLASEANSSIDYGYAKAAEHAVGHADALLAALAKETA